MRASGDYWWEPGASWKIYCGNGPSGRVKGRHKSKLSWDFLWFTDSEFQTGLPVWPHEWDAAGRSLQRWHVYHHLSGNVHPATRSLLLDIVQLMKRLRGAHTPQPMAECGSVTQTWRRCRRWLTKRIVARPDAHVNAQQAAIMTGEGTMLFFLKSKSNVEMTCNARRNSAWPCQYEMRLFVLTNKSCEKTIIKETENILQYFFLPGIKDLNTSLTF